MDFTLFLKLADTIIAETNQLVSLDDMEKILIGREMDYCRHYEPQDCRECNAASSEALLLASQVLQE